MTKYLCLFLAMNATRSFATTNASEEKTYSVINLDMGAAPAALKLPGIYKFESSVELLPKVEYIEGLKIVDPEPETLSFNADEPVAVSFRGNGDVLIQLLLTPEETGEIPEAVVVTDQEFNKANLKFISTGNLVELRQNFSSDEKVQEARRGRGFSRRGRAHYRNAAGGSYYGCVASVCKSIGGCMGTVGNGRGMTNYLRNKGWRSVSCSNPPIGAVASWTGGGHGLGHTGRWNGRGWCYDKGCGDPGRKYRLKDCVAK